MKIKYISWLPGVLGLENEEIEIVPSEHINLENLINILIQKGGKFQSVFKNREVIFASRDSVVIDKHEKLNNSDTITFFSPISGG